MKPRKTPMSRIVLSSLWIYASDLSAVRPAFTAVDLTCSNLSLTASYFVCDSTGKRKVNR
jgi:hypothetical protein